MANIKLTRKANTVKAPYLPYPAYKALVQLATDHNAEIGVNADRTLHLTFDEVETAKNVVAKWTADYEANRKVEATTDTKKPTASKGKTVTVSIDGVEYTVPADALVPTKAPKASSTKKTTAKTSAPKKSTTSSKKAPRKTKGNAFDYSVIKGKTNSDKNKALHKELVKMGLKDSRTPEYMSVWNARPWAK